MLPHALPALLGPVGSTDVTRRWGCCSKFWETPREAEAEASLGEGHRQGKRCIGSNLWGTLSSPLPLASRPTQALGMDSCGL